ncbi:MAG: hypothetical protein K6B13_03995, partial [Prevotella sp.]|nr:hypothetical protein [Prevotella sp.]
MKQQVIYSIAAMALVPGAANAADALTYAQFTAQEVGGWNNAQFKANLADFKARVTDYINDISDYETPDKDTNVDLNDCKQLGEIDWTDPANQTEDKYNTYRLYEFVEGYDGPKVFEQKLANAKKAINGAEALIWQTNAQTLLDEFTAGGTGLDAHIAAVKAQGVTEEYTDGDNTFTISMADHADALTALLNEDGVGIEDLLKDFVEFLEGYDGTGDPLPVTEYKAKFADPDGEFVKGVAEAKKLVDNLEAYNEYLGVFAADCRTELTNLNNLLEALQASIDNKAAEIDQRLVTQCRYNTYRFRAFTAVLNEFIKTAEANYTSHAWAYPTKLMGIALPELDWDGDGTNDFDAHTINYSDKKDRSGHMAGAITTLLGSSSANDFGWGTNAIAVMSDDEAFPIEKYSNNFSIRHTISYLKWRMQDYVAAKEALDAAIQKATKDYNKEIVRLETEIQAQDEKAATADFDEFKTFLENAKNDLYKKVKTAEKTGLEARIAQYEQSYKEGVIYDENGVVVDMVDDALNWKNVDDYGFADATGTTQAEMWIDEVQGVITALRGDIDDYVAKATDAANRYNTLEDLINGTENDDQLAKMQADLKFSEFPDKVKELYQNDYDQITADLATLTGAITDATKTVDDTGLDLQINDADWDNTATTSANWNVLDLDNDPLTYADIAEKIAVLKNNLDAAKAEYDAWQQLLTDADDLANRLKDASEALTDATDELADPTYNPADYYGYKGIGDDAAQNTKMAKMITDYVAALKAKADEAYGVGTADEGLTTGAKTFLDGGYKATPLVDTDDDSTLDFSWNTADTDIKL